MSDINHFKYSLFKFLNQYQMGNYTTRAAGKSALDAEEDADLNVLVIGRKFNKTPPMLTILPAVMANGQLPGTRLNIHICDPAPKGTIDSLLKRAPFLPHFAEIMLDGAPYDTGIPLDEKLCTLFFSQASLEPDKVKELIEERADCRYILIAAGNDTNQKLAKEIAGYPWTHSVLIGYVQSSKPRTTIADVSREVEPGMPALEIKAVPFGFDSPSDNADTDYSAELEKIALNLHYSYAKSADDKTPFSKIEKDFHDEYNYVSNIESALHLNAKLLSCGISGGDLKTRAAAFDKKLQSDQTLEDKLAVVEHRRWILSKVTDGYRQAESLDKIYRDGNTTHSRNKEDKWHTSLLPANWNSRIIDEDWDCKADFRKGLDKLDRNTLMIHRECMKRDNEYQHKAEMLRSELDKRLKGSDALSLYAQLKYAINELRIKKDSAIPRYSFAMNSLKAHLGAQNTTDAKELTEALKKLDDTFQPLIEYLSRKDYKEQDRILIRSIPFALTHKIRPNLLKLLSEKEADNMLSLRQLEPDHVIFAGTARTEPEFIAQKRRIEAIRKYIGNYMTDQIKTEAGKDGTAEAGAVRDYTVTAEYYILVPKNLFKREQDTEDQNYMVLVSDWAPDTIAAAIQEKLADRPDYIDVTGCSPELTLAAKKYADAVNTGLFYIWNGQLCNISRAEELEYHTIKKTLTVSEMFALCGAEPEKISSEAVTGLTEEISALWKIHQGASDAWKRICNSIADTLENGIADGGAAHKYYYELPKSGDAAEIRISVRNSYIEKFRNLFRTFKENGWITGTPDEAPTYGNYTEFILKLKAHIAPADDFQKKLQCAADNFGETSYFEVNPEGASKKHAYTGTAYFCMRSLKCTITLKNDSDAAVLSALEEKHFIHALTRNGKQCTFCFATEEILHIMSAAGNLLEAYIYYGCLSDCSFDDVETGFKFAHSTNENSAENEIDILATQGLSSLFISCKDRAEAQMKKDKTSGSGDNSYLNYVCYEILNEAEHFGINARPVLVSTTLPMFKGSEFSSEFIKCRSRGVYLLGKEAIDSGNAAKLLQDIMDGNEDWYVKLQNDTEEAKRIAAAKAAEKAAAADAESTVGETTEGTAGAEAEKTAAAGTADTAPAEGNVEAAEAPAEEAVAAAVGTEGVAVENAKAAPADEDACVAETAPESEFSHVTSFSQLKKGLKFRGKVTGIIKSGCFVDIGIIEDGNRKDGFVHISEITGGYVSTIDDVVKKYDLVTVIVKDIKGDKFELSISQAKK